MPRVDRLPVGADDPGHEGEGLARQRQRGTVGSTEAPGDDGTGLGRFICRGRCERNTRVALARDLADGLREPEGVAQWQQVVGAWHQDFPAVVELRRDHAAGP